TEWHIDCQCRSTRGVYSFTTHSLARSKLQTHHHQTLMSFIFIIDLHLSETERNGRECEQCRWRVDWYLALPQDQSLAPSTLHATTPTHHRTELDTLSLLPSSAILIILHTHRIDKNRYKHNLVLQYTHCSIEFKVTNC